MKRNETKFIIFYVCLFNRCLIQRNKSEIFMTCKCMQIVCEYLHCFSLIVSTILCSYYKIYIEHSKKYELFLRTRYSILIRHSNLINVLWMTIHSTELSEKIMIRSKNLITHSTSPCLSSCPVMII